MSIDNTKTHIQQTELQKIVASLLFASDRNLSQQDLQKLIEKTAQVRPEPEQLQQAIASISESLSSFAIELLHTATGYRLQTHSKYSAYVSSLWQEKTPKYSKAVLETLALIVYKQPITRGEIEHIRGVSVSSNIIRTLLERKWVRVLGHREVPGKPTIYGTTREFLDFFNLRSLSELPPLPALKSIEEIDQSIQQLVSATTEKQQTDPAVTEN